jgi:hypothetical protein
MVLPFHHLADRCDWIYEVGPPGLPSAFGLRSKEHPSKNPKLATIGIVIKADDLWHLRATKYVRH